MKDYGAKIRVFNNQLRSRWIASGLTIDIMCERIGIGIGVWYHLVSLKLDPKTLSGAWRKPARRIAEFFETPEEELFPNAGWTLPKRDDTVFFNADEAHALSGQAAELLPTEAAEHAELARDLRAGLARLTDREELIIRRLHGLGEPQRTTAELAVEFGLTRERIKQIKHMALRKLRHPGRARALLEHYDP